MAKTETVGSLLVRLLFDDSQYKKGVQGAEATTQKFGGGLVKMADFIQGAFVKAIKVGTVALTGFAVASTLVGSNFEQAISRVAAVKGIEKTSEDFARLEAKARELGASTLFSATQAAQGMEELARAGLTTDQILTASNDVLKLAAASGIELADAASIVASSMKQFNLGAEQSSRITDVMTAATQNSLFGMQDLAQAMKFAGTTGAALGLSIEETTAAVAQFRNLGLEGTMAGTQFRMMMAAAVKPTEQAEAALAKYKLTAQDINPELHSFREIMLSVGNAGMTVGDAMTVFGTRAGANVLKVASSMSQSSDDFDSFMDTLQNAAGTTEKTYGIMTDNVAGRFAELKSATEELLIGVFDTFSGPLNDLLQSVTRFVRLVAQEVGVASGSIGGDMDSVLGGIADMIDRNAIQWAQQIGEIVVAASGFARVLSNNIVPLLETILPLVDDIAIILATIWATQKAMAFAAFITGVVIPAISATTFSLSGMGAALVAATGGLSALAAGVAVVVTGLGVLIARLISSKQATEDLAAAQERASERARIQDKVVLEGARTRLAATKEQLIAEKERLAAQGQLTDKRAREIDQILKLDAAEAALMVRRGELMSFNGKLLTTHQLLTDEGVEGQKLFSKAIDTTKDTVSRLQAELEKAGSTAEREQIANELSEAQDKLLTLRNVQVSVTTASAEAAAVRDKEAEALNKLNKGLFNTQGQMEAIADSEKDATKAAEAFLDMIDDLRDDIAQVGLTEEQTAAFALAKRREAIEKAFREQVAKEKATGERMVELRQQREEALDLVERLGQAQRASEEKKAAEELAKEEEKNARQVREKIAKLMEDAEVRGLKESEKLQREYDLEVKPLLAQASAEERLAIEADYSKRIQDLRKQEAEDSSAIGFWDRLGATAKAAFAGMSGAAHALGAAMSKVKSIGEGMLGLFAKLTQFSLDIKGSLDAAAQAGADVIAGGGTEEEAAAASREAAVSFVDGIVEGALQFIEVLLDTLPEIIQRFLDAIPVVITKLLDALPQVVKTIADGIPILVQRVVDAIPDIVQAIVDAIPVIMDSLMEATRTIMDFIANQLPDLIGQLLDALMSALDQMLAELPKFLDQLLNGIIGIIDQILTRLPDIITMLLDALPKVIDTILKAIPMLISTILQALPDIITSLIEGIIRAIPQIITSIIQAIPQIIVSILEAIPRIIGSILRAIPTIITTLIGAIPDLIISIAQSIPDLLPALINLIPELIVETTKFLPQIIGSLFKAFFYELPKQTPRMIIEVFKALFEAIKKALAAIKDSLADMFRSLLPGGKKKGKGDQGTAMAGIGYVPATMRMTLHKGEAVIPASRNPEGPAGGADPAMAGAGVGPASSSGTGGGWRADIAFMADGRMLDAVMIQSSKRGTGVKVQRAMRKTSGTKIGLDRGKFSPWSS